MTGPDVRTPGTSRANAGQTTTADPIVADLDAKRKAFLTLQAQAAIAGCELTRTKDGAFVLSRWNLSRELRDLDAVAELLARITGAHHG